jgi:hypothetical protein
MTKKLSLSRQTLRNLSDKALGNVRGGRHDGDSALCDPTRGCPSEYQTCHVTFCGGCVPIGPSIVINPGP